MSALRFVPLIKTSAGRLVKTMPRAASASHRCRRLLITVPLPI